jgi:hypothetical protein
MMNSVARDGRCRPRLAPSVLFALAILVTTLLVVWPGWLRTAQARSWVSEEGGGVRHIVVTLNKSRTLRFDKPFASAVVGGPDILDALPMSDRVLRCHPARNRAVPAKSPFQPAQPLQAPRGFGFESSANRAPVCAIHSRLSKSSNEPCPTLRTVHPT